MSEGPRAFFKTYLPRDMSFEISNNSDNSLEKFSVRLRNAALRMVARRRLTEHQLRTRLEKKISSKWYDMFRANISEEVREGVIEKIILRFRELGYVNDADFVELFVRDTLEYRPHGFLWIKMQLIKKGVDKEIISSVLERMREERSNGEAGDGGPPSDDAVGDVEYLGARALAEKKIGILSGRNLSGRSLSRTVIASDDKKIYEKLFRFLCSRGYPASVAFRVLGEMGMGR